MTLIITVVTPHKVVQASDRRLTRNGKPVTEKANKSLCVQCVDAVFSVAYTGRADISGQPTDEWFLNLLIFIKAYNLPIDIVIVTITQHLTRQFKQMRKKGSETPFVLAGFEGGTWPPFLAIISNFERDGVFPHGPPGEFLSHKDSIASNKLRVAVSGRQDAVQGTLWREIRYLAKTNFFAHHSGKEVSDELVAFIRRAAENNDSGRFVGKNCMTVWHSPGPNLTFNAHYHPNKNEPIQYTPHLLINPGLAFKGFEMWSGGKAGTM